ncbi:MAG TPA: hypothetical protein VMU75_07575 [Acidimicrobiales bacterium]|nr:hypothetical protein [Acidimicrobiales bacterium]
MLVHTSASVVICDVACVDGAPHLRECWPVRPGPPANEQPARAPVELAHWEVEPDVLASEGETVDELLVAMGFIDDAGLRSAWRFLPERGWRLIYEDLAARVYAAPEAEPPGTWSLVHLVVQGGIWSYAATVREVVVRPGRATRRKDVDLVWPETTVFTAGTTPKLFASLVNTSTRTWRGDSGELLHVVAYLADLPSGRRLLASRWVGFSPKWDGSDDLVVIPPGGSARLPATLATLWPERISPGLYGIVGHLARLDLTSSTGLVSILAP